MDGEENLSESDEDHSIIKNEAKLMSSRIGETMTSGNEPNSTRIEIQTPIDLQCNMYNRLRGS